MFEALADNARLDRNRSSHVLARIGPEGVEWTRHAPKVEGLETALTSPANLFTEARRARLLSSLKEDQRRLELLHEEQKVLKHIARQRGPGSLHDDLMSPES